MDPVDPRLQPALRAESHRAARGPSFVDADPLDPPARDIHDFEPGGRGVRQLEHHLEAAAHRVRPDAGDTESRVAFGYDAEHGGRRSGARHDLIREYVRAPAA